MTTDFLIIGAGPVGLFLACEISLHGASVRVLEQVSSPDSPLKRAPFGMRGLSIPTLEAFDRRGLLDAIAPDATRRQAGHFAGIAFHDADIDTQWPWRLPSPTATNRAGEMARIETVLAERALAQGVDIRRGVDIDSLTQTADGVTVTAGPETFAAQYLVGCDGGRSVVRKTAGFTLVGTDAEFTGYSAHVEIADPEKLKPGRNLTATGLYFQSQAGHLSMAEFDGGAHHRAGPVTLDHIQAVLRRLSGTDVTLTKLHTATTWTDRAQQATSYRNGRVLLAGDAAHIHSPLGGQGLNLGLGDAMNLGWKLAAVARGDMPASLLDSYQAERHPVGAEVLDWSRAQVALMRPAAASRALEAVVRDLIATRDGATYFAGRVWGINLRYDMGEIHELSGRSVPDFALSDGTRPADWLRSGHGLLLDFGGDSALRDLAAGFARLTYIHSNAHDHLGLAALLVRPDGVVAWTTGGDITGARLAVERWFRRIET